MKIVSKIAVAQVIGKVPTQIVEVSVIGEDGKPTVEKQKRGIEQALMRIVGLATGSKAGNSTFGEFIAFTGQFQATNILTGEIYRAGKIFFPKMIEDLLATQVAATENGVEFAFDIGVKPSGNAHGYEYTVTTLMAIAENDPLKLMADRLTASAPALPAPKTAAQLTLPVEAAKETAPVEETKTTATTATKTKK